MPVDLSKLPPDLTEPGAIVAGKYRVEEILAVGGMGVVAAARNEGLDQAVVLKVLRPDVGASAEVTARFLQEARTAARLTSEHVVRVFDVGTTESGAPYMVMERLHGNDLQQVLDMRGPLPVKDVVDHLLEALEAIAEAHAAGVVHRDLKPSNLFLAQRTDGSRHVKVLDFGISKPHGLLAKTGGPVLTTADQVLGSPGFMSPEQMMRPSDVDGRSDIWSIGVVLYTLVTGEMPFQGETVAAVMANILFQPVPKLKEKRPDAPAALQRALDGCLDRDQNARFAHVGELARVLAPMGSDWARLSVERIDKAIGTASPAGQSLLRSSLPPRSSEVPGQAAWTAAVTGRGSQKKRIVGIVGIAAVVIGGAVAIGWSMMGRAPATDALGSSSATAGLASSSAELASSSPSSGGTDTVANGPAPAATATSTAAATSAASAAISADPTASAKMTGALPGTARPATANSGAPAGGTAKAGAGAAPKALTKDDEAKLLGDRK